MEDILFSVTDRIIKCMFILFKFCICLCLWLSTFLWILMIIAQLLNKSFKNCFIHVIFLLPICSFSLFQLFWWINLPLYINLHLLTTDISFSTFIALFTNFGSWNGSLVLFTLCVFYFCLERWSTQIKNFLNSCFG